MIFRPSNFERLTLGSTNARSLQNIPTGATDDLISAIITVDNDAVRFRADGIDPTALVGVQIISGAPPLILANAGTLLRTARFIGTVATVQMDVQYFTAE